MIRWARLGRDAERYYLGPVRAGLEPAGRWLGGGVPDLGLGHGPVGASDLGAVLGGRHPGGGGRLTPRQTRVAGFDLTFAVPKSVSLLWALSPAAVAAEVDDAHQEATRAALGYLERRARRDGSGPAALVAAGFQHHQSRAGDPHLHLHVVVANLRRTAAGWRALDSPPLIAHVPTAGFLFEAHLRHELTRRLAVRFGPVVDGVAQVEGIDAEVRAAFSSRRRQVRRVMADHGGSSSRSARIAALDGRPPRPGGTLEECRARWSALASGLGWGPDRVAAVVGSAATAGVAPGGAGAPGPRPIAERIGLSSFCRRDVIRAVCSDLSQGATVDTAEAAADAALQSSECVALSGPLVLTTGDVMRAGGRLVPVGTDVARWTTRGEAERQRRLAADARRADGRIELLAGPPGPDRWAALGVARQRWMADGLDVAAVAPDRRSARELEAATGLAVRVLAGGLPETLPDVLVVSGAEALTSADAAALVGVAAGGSTRLVLVGDPGAVPRADRAGAWRALESVAGVTRLRAAEPPPGRSGVDHHSVERPPTVRVGERLTLAAGHEELRRGLVEDWLAGVQRGRPPDAVIVALRRPDVEDLNRRAATGMLEAGLLGEVTSVPGGSRLREGETVLVASVPRGSPLRPGQRWVLGEGARLRSSEGTVVEPGPGVELRRGYAMTPYQARLAAPSSALVLGDPVLYRASPAPADCSASFYAVADLSPDAWAGGRGPVHAQPPASRQPAAPAGLWAAADRLDVLEDRVDRLRRSLVPPADPSDELAAAREERQASLAAQARLGPSAPESAGWRERAARAEERIARLADVDDGRGRWMAGHAEELAAYAEALAASAVRRQALARAAELDAPAEVLELIGPRPDDPSARSAWRQAAGRLLSYRERWGIDPAGPPLGPTAADPRQTAERRELTLAVRALGRGRRAGLEPLGSEQAAPSLEPAGFVPELR